MNTKLEEIVMDSEEVVRQKYRDTYSDMRKEAEGYLKNPDRLKAELELEKRQEDRFKLRTPYPDPFAYRMTRYKSFVRYPERLQNFITAEREPRSVNRPYMPYIIDIEPNSRCNCRCIMCQVSEWKNGKRADDMTLDELKVFMEGQPCMMEVKLHGMGDPFINKEFIEMTEYLVEKDIWVRTSTNALLLHAGDNYKKILDAGIGEMQISFDGATRAVYENIRRGANFDRAVKNCTMVNEYANRLERLYTRMWVVVQELNRDQIFDFVEIAIKMQFRRISFSMTLNDWGQDDWGIRNKKHQAGKGLSEEEKHRLAEMAQQEGIDITVWEQASKYSADNPDTLCPWPFTRPYITSDLRVVPCCMIANPDVRDLGNAREFNQLWNSPVYNEFRRAHLEGRIPECCRNCYS